MSDFLRDVRTLIADKFQVEIDRLQYCLVALDKTVEKADEVLDVVDRWLLVLLQASRCVVTESCLIRRASRKSAIVHEMLEGYRRHCGHSYVRKRVV